MTYTNLEVTLITLLQLKELEVKGERTEWGYDLDSIYKVISYIQNELKLKEE